MFFVDRIKLKTTEKGSYYGNFAFRHILTPFGNDIALDLFYEAPKLKIALAVHNYNSKNLNLIGLEGKLVDFPVVKNYLSISPRLMFWMQPKDYAYYAKKIELGTLASISTRYEKHPIIKPYIQLEAKSNGFVMGNVNLESNFSVSTGLKFDISAKVHKDPLLFKVFK